MPVDPDETPLTPQDVVEVVDEAEQEFVDDLQNPEDELAADSGQMTTMAASKPTKARVPKWRRANGSKIWPKYYIYSPRNPVRRSWHDYCSGLWKKGVALVPVPDSWTFTVPAPQGPGYRGITVSFKGPCARHDLCIQYKQAPQNSYGRLYCDDEVKTHIRMNCRYYIRADLYPNRRSARDDCYGKASLYKHHVRKTTWGYAGYGHWGHNAHQSTYPTYRYDKWIQ